MRIEARLLLPHALSDHDVSCIAKDLFRFLTSTRTGGTNLVRLGSMELAELRLAKLHGYSLVSKKALDLLKSERHTREVEKDLRMVFYLTQCLIRCLFHRIHDSLAWRSLFLLCGVSCSNNIGFLRKLNFELSGEELRISFLERDVRKSI